ncbi:MAG: class I SAM-dependent DNA methyltransferase, partial [Anaerolineae bacterium]
VDPSIFGTLFERVIDEGKRAQLGAHYTSESDIMLIVEPVLMEPLRRKWDEARRGLNLTGLQQASSPSEDALKDLSGFAAEIAHTRVLDPACGSGNFLYVALRQLLNLQKEVIAYAARKGLPPIELSVSPEQLYGIEINPYAHELAQVTVWIGYLQWRMENGFGEMDDPILRPLRNIRRMDAILAYDVDCNPIEPEWPAADVIIGNPPFLGDKKMRAELGHKYVGEIRTVYNKRVPGGADLVTYWFEKARKQLAHQRARRIGLIATNSIRGGANREVLDRVKQTGEIFTAWSDNPWVLDGAAVRVSIVGFDDGTENLKILDGRKVQFINADLTSAVDLTQAQKLTENINISFIGTQKGGKFDIPHDLAQKMLADNETNNSDVVRPWVNGLDVVRRPRNMWIIYFPENFEEDDAAKYSLPFQYVVEHIKPSRLKNSDRASRKYWWLHQRPRGEMKLALANLNRYIGTARVAKHRLFIWLDVRTVPDSQVVAFAREDDCFFGVLHSRPHEIWSLRLGTWLGKGNDPRYTPTTTFETFPFPWPPGQEPPESTSPQVAAIAHWARALVAWRQAWLNPPPPAKGAIDVAYEKRLKARTLTNLYNGLVYFRAAKPRHPISSRNRMSASAADDQFRKVTRGSVTRAEIEELDDIHVALD